MWQGLSEDLSGHEPCATQVSLAILFQADPYSCTAGTPMTTATGIGPLPEILERQESRKALRKVFAAEGVPLSVITERQQRIPLSTLAGLFHRAASAVGDWRLGLEVGGRMPPGEYGLWARYAIHAPTLGGALERAVETLQTHQTGTVMRLVPGPAGLIAWEYDHPAISSGLFREHTDHIVPCLLRFARAFLGHDWRPVGIEVGYPKPQHASELEIATESPWHFGRPCFAILLPASALRTEKPRVAGQPVREPLLSYQDVLDGTAPERIYGPVADIASVISLRLLDRSADIEGAAGLLGSGRRRIQRRLEEQGLSYRSLVTEIRMRRARSLIEGTPAPLKQVGYDLGYTDPAHFTRAFTRHYGFAPSQLRDRQKTG